MSPFLSPDSRVLPPANPTGEDALDRGVLRLALPKGRMQDSIGQLLADAGLALRSGERSYRPDLGRDDLEAKVLRPQNAVRMLAEGSRDLGFAGADWVAELDADIVELLDTELDPVRLVVAAPPELLEDGRLPARPLRLAGEFKRLCGNWIATSGLDLRFVRAYGATEVFPPEDADAICDLVHSGATLRANGLVEVETILKSSTRLFASRQALQDPEKADAIQDFTLLLRSVLDARRRVMLELNCEAPALARITGALPCMREATVAGLAGGHGFAVKAAVPREQLSELIPQLKRLGGCDLIVTNPSQIVT